MKVNLVVVIRSDNGEQNEVLSVGYRSCSELLGGHQHNDDISCTRAAAVIGGRAAGETGGSLRKQSAEGSKASVSQSFCASLFSMNQENTLHSLGVMGRTTFC